MKILEIIVSPNGEVRLETHGFEGRECLDATRQLELALGAKTGDQLTSEFYRLPMAEEQRLQEGR